MGYKITIVGSGNWGSAIARIIGETTRKHSDLFDRTVKMWVFEEMVDGRKLSEIINTEHVNVKYLPGRSIPDNVVAEPDIVKAVSEADILVFVVPHEFVPRICAQILGKIKLNAVAISLIKGITIAEDGSIKLISSVISDALHVRTAVLMGANLAHEVANESFCEATIGSKDASLKPVLKKLFETENFRITTVDDADTVELCGALKNIVACAAGFTDGMGSGDNTKAAVIRLGLMEMTKFIEHFYPGSHLKTFFESCGIADLITTCYGGRNRKVSEAFVRTGKSMKELEVEMLDGQRLQGPHTAELVNVMIESHKMTAKFPLFTSVHKICIGERKPTEMINYLRHHPEHVSREDSAAAQSLADCTCSAARDAAADKKSAL